VTFFRDDNFSWTLAALLKYELSSRPERSEVEGPTVLCTSHRTHLEATLFLLSSRAKPRDLQFYRHLFEMFFNRVLNAGRGESVPRLRRSDRVGNRYPSPGRAGLAFSGGPYGPRSPDRFLEITFPGGACGTADPSASLGMTKGRGVPHCGSDAGGENRRSLPLRCAPVGMIRI
jgi:hypothetical protein